MRDLYIAHFYCYEVLNMSFQPLSDSVYASKYQLFDKHGNAVDKNRGDSFLRIAKALAKNEKDSQYWTEQFFIAMQNGAVPAGRIFGNAGAEEHKPNTSLINCLAGETPVLTKQGIKTIRELAEGSSVEILNGNGVWSTVVFNSYGVQPVHTIQFRFADSKEIKIVRATKQHRWIVPTDRVITTEFWLSGDRAKGYCNVPNIFIPKFEVDFEEYNQGLLHGLVYGDGNYNNYTKDNFDLTLCSHKMELSQKVSEILGQNPKGPYVLNNTYGTEGLRFSNFSSEVDLKQIPSEQHTQSYVKGFFAGLLATDGNLYSTAERSMSICLYGQLDLMQYLDKMLPTIGILPSAAIKKLAKKGEKTNFGIRNKSIYTFHVHPATIDTNDILLMKHREVFKVSHNGLVQSRLWHMVNVSDSYELAEVFCCQEPETGSFCLMHGMLTGNCVVSDIIYDNIEGIGQSVKESLVTLSGGSGIGYDFSSLRPKGSYVNGVKAQTSGPLPFADIFDKGCFTIASAGGRRGAQMATFDLRHPDVLDFIKVKRENGRFRQFNISVLVPYSFFNDEKDWVFRFPIRNSDPALSTAKTMWDTWHVKDFAYITNEHGQTLFKIYGKMPKVELWDLILQSNYEYAEPGVIFIDRVNEENNLWFCEEIRASNPCGEQMLPPNNSCLLGSIDLTQFIDQSFTDNASFNFTEFSITVNTFTRMLDNVVEFNNLPLQAQRDEIVRKRRHGMGFFGLGSALVMLGIRYDSPQALEFAEKVTKLMAVRGYVTGCELAKEKGSAPVLDEYFEITPEIVRKNELFKDRLGQKVKGIELFLASPYMQRLLADEPILKDQLLQHGCRFSHHTSIAPTGTISLAFGNNASGGIEPSFSHQYFRNLTVEGKKTRQQEAVYSKEFLLYKELYGQGKTDEELLKQLPNYFITADTISWKAHVDMVAVVQKWVDSSISKTCNVPTEITLEEFKGIYDYAYQMGCKAVSTFRYNPETLGSILSRSEDLANSRYEFKLADGTVIQCAGGDRVEYDGEVTTAENLFSALKENTYGKF